MERNKQETVSHTQQQQQDESSVVAVDEQMMVDSDTVSEMTTAGSHDSAATNAAAAAGGGPVETSVEGSAGTETSAAGEMAGTSSSADDHTATLLDDVECKFNVNSYHMIFVVNTESFLYRRHSLSTARQVRSGRLLHISLWSVTGLNIKFGVILQTGIYG